MSSSSPPTVPALVGAEAPVNIPTAPVLAPRIAFESLALRGISPPTALYVTADDSLLVRAHASVAGLTVGVRARILNPDGDIIPSAFQVLPTSNRVAVTKVFQLAEGFLLGGAVQLDAGTARRGQCFVQVILVRGGALASDPGQSLVSDYIVSGEFVGWPQGRVQQSIEGPGILRSITGTAPGAGNQVNEVVPVGARWLLRSFRMTLTTSAAAGVRRVHFIVDDGATILLDHAAGDTQALNTTRNYNEDPAGIIRVAQDNEIYVPINSDWRLFAGYRLRTTVTAGDVGDVFAAPQYEVEEWLEP